MMAAHVCHDQHGEPRTDDDGRLLQPATVTCGICGRAWCGRCDPAPSALCPWCHGPGYSTAPIRARKPKATAADRAHTIVNRLYQLGDEPRATWGEDAPMYSYNRPGPIFWHGVVEGLLKRRWSQKRILAWLQSKDTRWLLDGSWGEALLELGTKLAQEIE